MASKGLAVAGSPMRKSEYDWQCEQDVRSLVSAAEVMADHGRAKAAMKKFKKQRKGADALIAAFGRGGKMEY